MSTKMLLFGEDNFDDDNDFWKKGHDTQINCADGFIEAHKVKLCSKSAKFRDFFGDEEDIISLVRNENGTFTLDLPTESRETMNLLVQFIYDGDYNLDNTTRPQKTAIGPMRTRAEAKNSRPEPRDGFLIHFRVYNMAIIYQVRSLAIKALQKYRTHANLGNWEQEGFITSLQLAYSDETEDNVVWKTLLSSIVYHNCDTLLELPSFVQFMESKPGIGLDMLRLVRIEDPFRRAHNAEAMAWFCEGCKYYKECKHCHSHRGGYIYPLQKYDISRPKSVNIKDWGIQCSQCLKTDSDLCMKSTKCSKGEGRFVRVDDITTEAFPEQNRKRPATDIDATDIDTTNVDATGSNTFEQPSKKKRVTKKLGRRG